MFNQCVSLRFSELLLRFGCLRWASRRSVHIARESRTANTLPSALCQLLFRVRECGGSMVCPQHRSGHVCTERCAFPDAVGGVTELSMCFVVAATGEGLVISARINVHQELRGTLDNGRLQFLCFRTACSRSTQEHAQRGMVCSTFMRSIFK